MKAKLGGNLSQEFCPTMRVSGWLVKSQRRCMVLLIALFFVGCNFSPKPTATISPDFKSGGGQAYAQVVKNIYTQAWEPNTSGAMPDAFTRVRITIGKDGNVVSAKILKSSGDEKMDASVQKTLDNIKFVQPFESGAKDLARTFIINFDLKPKK